MPEPHVVNLPMAECSSFLYKMGPVLLLLLQMAESVGDTTMARGSKALTKAGIPVYQSVLAVRHQNVPGADADYELLNPYFDLPDQPDGGNP